MTDSISIDSAGRIVLPDAVRRRLNLVAGSRLRLAAAARGGRRAHRADAGSASASAARVDSHQAPRAGADRQAARRRGGHTRRARSAGRRTQAPPTSAALDTSVVLASLDPDEPQHVACDRLLAAGGHRLYVHTLAEVFSVLTGGRHGRRLHPSTAVQLLEESVLPFVQVVALTAKDVMSTLAQCQSRGVRGGAIYDFLHLAAARKAGAEALVTLDLRDLQALTRPGDPRIEAP